MPEDFDRRSFIRRTSMGAVAVGALIVTGGSLLDVSSAQAATPKAPRHDETIVDGSDVIAHVVNARTGEISILVGTREVKHVDRALAQQLMRAAK